MPSWYLQLFDLKAFRNVPASALLPRNAAKLAITVALMKQPEILLLDEPTLGLDILSSESVIQLLKDLAQERKLSILIITHDIHLIEQLNCRLIFMNHGKISCDSSLSKLKQESRNAEIPCDLADGRQNRSRLSTDSNNSRMIL